MLDGIGLIPAKNSFTRNNMKRSLDYLTKCFISNEEQRTDAMREQNA